MEQNQKYLSIKELFDFSGKVAIVTGGTMGIGLGCSRRLAEAGAALVIAARGVEKGEEVTKELVDSGYKVAFVKCDVSQKAEVVNLVENTVKTFGRLDIMVNNAGIFPKTSVDDAETVTWDRVIDVNVKGAFYGCREAAQQMIKQGWGGSIINIASVSACQPQFALSAYDASKGGVWMLTRNLAVELAPYKIRVNSISPGMIKTEGASSPDAIEYSRRRLYRVPLGRAGRPDEIGNVVLFLASPAASYMTGSDIIVDAGFTLTSILDLSPQTSPFTGP
ncbi:SDR family NAD(P)-dependent oxidoreductase [Chloroflexota bacterium]